MSGKLYGVGVGPGDPELMTVKAVHAIRGCDVVAIPQKERDKCMAYRIAQQTVPELDCKPILPIHMPMTKDKAVLEAAFAEGERLLREQLDAGKTVAFLTIGDPTVYSTYCYLHTRVTEAGYDTCLIPGVPSFCASAAALNIPLCLGKEQVHIIPGTFTPVEALDYPGVKVFMKNNLPQTLEAAKTRPISAWMVENCGLPTEKRYHSLEEIPADAGYFSVMIVKEEEK